MEARMEKLESNIGDIRVGQAGIKTSLNMMEKTLDTLVDLRAESLHLIKMHEQDRKDHDEIFCRLRKAEEGRATCDEKHTVVNQAVEKLEKNQKWGVLFIVASIGTYIFKKLFL